MIKVFMCPKCKYEDSCFIPDGFMHQKGPKCDNGTVYCPSCKSVVKKNIEKRPEASSISLRDYLELLDYIMKNHNWNERTGKCIKYISHTYDTRTGKIFSIKLDDMIFSQTNENKHKDLKQWIIGYLAEKEV
ncbi:hypothetical protein [Clostridium tertium]|uniref:hypothetical protein n=1 Tax=Clostridium tertium TaxID=1559 RepID=UPI0023B278D2|nr:hypothetical protein [Clostridium tertium]